MGKTSLWKFLPLSDMMLSSLPKEKHGNHTSSLASSALLNVRLPLWLSIKISGGIDTLLAARQGGQGLGGLPIPQRVPATSMHFRPGDKTTYLVGTASGEVLLVGVHLIFF